MLEINKIHNYNCLDGLKLLDDNSIDCCVTSPPYWGLRDYGTATWIGGDINCSHKRDSKWSANTITGHANKELTVGDAIYKNTCPKCGATRQDEQLGLEKTPEEYVAKMVEVFNQVKRVLKKEGTLWLNLGDTYYNYRGENDYSTKQTISSNNAHEMNSACGKRNVKQTQLKGKDLVGIPWMTAFALRADGWYLRQDIIWHKPNPMPESVTDRCTKSHEYIFLLSKSQKYYYDHESIKVKMECPEHDKRARESRKCTPTSMVNGIRGGNNTIYEFSNKRDVWTINTKPYSGAHFATFPEELIVDMIRAGCPKDGIILDPFMGAGTTAVVARKLNRNFIGFELNPKYITIAEKRLYEELGMFL